MSGQRPRIFQGHNWGLRERLLICRNKCKMRKVYKYTMLKFFEAVAVSDIATVILAV